MGDWRVADPFVRDMHRRNLAAGTIEKRVSVLRRCETAIGKPILEATEDDLLGWLDSRHTVGAKSRYTDISHLACYFHWAVINDLIVRDPTARIIRPQVRRCLPRPIPTADLEYVISQASAPQLHGMLMCAAYAGMRCAEISALDGGDVLDSHDPPLIVAHGKGGKDRTIPAHPDVLRALRRIGIPHRGPVFEDDGVRVPPWRVSHRLREHMHDCGVDCSGHQLRHWFGTNVYEQSGHDLRLTQELLGHASPATTAIYTQWSRKQAALVVGRLRPDPDSVA